MELGCPFAKLSTCTCRDLIPLWSDSLKCLPTMWISEFWLIFLMCSPSISPFKDSLIKLLTRVLSKTNFDFNEKHYFANWRYRYGNKCSYANTFMGWFDDEFVYTYFPAPTAWKRFIDDIFIIWTHVHKSLDAFICHLDDCLPSIKFKAESSSSHVNFPDVTVSLDE